MNFIASVSYRVATALSRAPWPVGSGPPTYVGAVIARRLRLGRMQIMYVSL